MQFYHLGIGGGVNFFFSYSEARSAAPPPPPPAEMYEQSHIVKSGHPLL